MKRVVLIGIVALVIGAFVAGFWPQHLRLLEAEVRIQSLQQRLSAADGRIRTGEILGQLLRLSDAVIAHDYGQAAAMSTTCFDRVREEISRADRIEVKQALEGILQSRDQVTAALMRTDPAVASTLHDQDVALRRVLGYPVETPTANGIH